MRSRQRIVRALIANIIADVDDEARQVILTIHWRRRSAFAVAGPQAQEWRTWPANHR